METSVKLLKKKRKVAKKIRKEITLKLKDKQKIENHEKRMLSAPVKKALALDRKKERSKKRTEIINKRIMMAHIHELDLNTINDV